jgi:uncharacterized membrane protein
LKRAAWTFAQAFLAVLAVMAPGVLQAPNLATARALGVAALVAAIAAGLSAVKNMVLSPGSPAR